MTFNLMIVKLFFNGQIVACTYLFTKVDYEKTKYAKTSTVKKEIFQLDNVYQEAYVGYLLRYLSFIETNIFYFISVSQLFY